VDLGVVLLQLPAEVLQDVVVGRLDEVIPRSPPVPVLLLLQFLLAAVQGGLPGGVRDGQGQLAVDRLDERFQVVGQAQLSAARQGQV
jgi:hypothetical protein